MSEWKTQFTLLSLDRDDPKLKKFRSEVCQENGANFDYLEKSLTYKESKDYFDSLECKGDFEEVWKYGNTKWKQAQLLRVEAAVCNATGEVASISGCRMYSDNMMRVGMHLYTLKKYRKTCRNIQFDSEGFFYRHINFAREMGGVESLFMTVYAHNKKLESHVKNLGQKKMSPDGGRMSFIEDLIAVEEPLEFHSVPQHFFLYPLSKDFNWIGRAPLPQ